VQFQKATTPTWH